MDPYDSVHKRLSALAEWLKTSAQETSSVDVNTNKLHQNHVTYFYHPYANFSGHFVTNNGFANPGNKPQRERTTFKESHLQILERCFNEVKHPDTSRREKLATQLGFPAKTIQIWFQNRRARERKGGKEKRTGDEEWQNLSAQENNYYINFDSGSSECSISQSPETSSQQQPSPPTTELSSTTSDDHNGIKTCTTTVVQELDSSKRYNNQNGPDTIQEDERTKKDFTIIHIPEEQSNPNTNNITPVCMKTTADTDISNDFQRNYEEIPAESSIEQLFASSVENLNLDLIVNTYEVLQSSDNADVLINKWLAEYSQEDVNKQTLEENLKRFIQFSQKSLI